MAVPIRVACEELADYGILARRLPRGLVELQELEALNGRFNSAQLRGFADCLRSAADALDAEHGTRR